MRIRGSRMSHCNIVSIVDADSSAAALTRRMYNSTVSLPERQTLSRGFAAERCSMITLAHGFVLTANVHMGFIVL